ncbi:eukaryotic-like serine/threonine-protein kinase [Microdochium nivale]|nr:eukaryotic-like serine/threonine-protein kinase [Microdochium nivale]
MITVSSHSSDLCRAVENIVTQDGLVGYRNVVSYVAALGLPVLPRTAMDEAAWKWLGAGSFSTTFEGSVHHRGTASVVAIKQPSSPLVRDKKEVESRVQHLALSSVIQECRILADPKLRSHPNLPHIIGVYFQEERGIQGVRPCLVMELAVSDFRGFLEAHAREGRDATDLARACSQIANGLCVLHAYGLVHGDVKPENVLMFRRGEVIVATVADLGTCGIQGQAQPIVGTSAFWAPEMHAKSPFRGSANRSSRDVYSFGLLVYAAVTYYRERPFPMPVEEQFRLQHEDAECLSRLLLKIPQNSVADHLLREIVRRCVRSDFDRRPPIFEVCRMLEENFR